MSEPLFPPYAIKKIVERLSHLISQHCSMSGIEEVTPVVVLKGAFMFAADLIRALEARRVDVANIEFIEAAFYEWNEPKDQPKITSTILNGNLAGRHVLVIDDILDSGKTLKGVVGLLQSAYQCESIMVTVLMSRREYMLEGVECFIGETNIGEGWVFGYGMDDRDLHRGTAGIRIIREP